MSLLLLWAGAGTAAPPPPPPTVTLFGASAEGFAVPVAPHMHERYLRWDEERVAEILVTLIDLL